MPGLTDRAARGPAARYVWDLADRGNSRWVVPHGASGTPGSPHHRDQQPLWLAGELVPVITDFDRLTHTHTQTQTHTFTEETDEVDLPDVHLPEKKAQLAFLRREVAFPG
ncbi:penicillin acylase family protein [Streptomyces olivaceus]|nr:penicillin acylase family protein [Streptomyces olivaceus]